jgi:chemotaxis protein histidine kinase CheA/ActR/RegA family two-component response regulator
MSNTFDKLSVLDSFIEEVNSYLPEIETNLQRLAQVPGDMEAIEETYRRTHTIGGSASMMDFPGLAHVAHGMEDILGDVLDEVATLDNPTIVLLQRSLARMHILLKGIHGGVNEDAIIAEDDADYVQYRSQMELQGQAQPQPQPTSDAMNMSETVLNVSAITEEDKIVPPASPTHEIPAVSGTSSSYPSLDEVLESFMTPSFEPGKEIDWPEELDASPSAFDEITASPQEPDFSESSEPQSALEMLVSTTRHEPTQSAPPVTPRPGEFTDQEDQTTFYPDQDRYLASEFEQEQDNRQLLAQSQGVTSLEPALPQAYIELHQETQLLEAEASSFKAILNQLRVAMNVIEQQRAEFKGFLDGSKDALDRMEDWAGRAMGLNLRNSPEQVRRYLPLSVMWVSNSKLKKVLDALTQIASGMELTDEQIPSILRQLSASIASCGEVFLDMQAQAQTNLPGRESGWTPWEVQVAQDAETLRERVTFERQGDPDALRAEIEATLREELRQEYENRPVSLATRAELEQQIREEMRHEFDAKRKLQESVSGPELVESLEEIESRLRSEIEIQVRQEFLSQITDAGTDLLNMSMQQTLIPPAPSAPRSSNFVDQARASTGLPSYEAPASPSQLQQERSIVVTTPSASSPIVEMPAPSSVPHVVQKSMPEAALPYSGDFGEEAAEIFRLEAEEHLQTISMHVAALEQEPENREIIQGIRRATHTLKGAAGMMGFRAIADLSHISEDLLDSIMEGATSITPAVLSIILDTVETFDGLITGLGADSSEEKAKVEILRVRYAELLGTQNMTVLSGEVDDIDSEDDTDEAAISETLNGVSSPETNAQRAARGDLSVRVRLQKLDELVNLFGELLVNRSILEERIERLVRLVNDVGVSSNRLRDVGQKLESRFEAATLPSGRTIQVMPDLNQQQGGRFIGANGHGNSNGNNNRVEPAHLAEFDELELDRYTEFHMLTRGLSEGISDMTTLSTEMEAVIREAESVFSRENRLNTTFQDRLMKARLVPLSTMTPRLYRGARAVALKQGKEFEFMLEGESTEVDRTVYEEIAGPLLHLMRNAANHALETPEVRIQKGKPPVGQIKLSASYEGNQVVITVRDDGVGLDPERIRNAAIASNLIRPDQVLSDSDVVDFIFRPGFSTAETLSEESGRGVGLDVVRDGVSRLRGTLEVESMPGQGTAFTMKFPTSLAIQSTMMVQVSDQQFAIPTVIVDAIGRLDSYKRTTIGGHLAVTAQNEHYPVHTLAEYLSLPPTIIDEKAQVLLIHANNNRVALVVDEIRGKFDVVMKNLGPHLRNVRGIAGGTVMGNGRVVLILELGELFSTRTGRISSATRTSSVPVRRDASPAAVSQSSQTTARAAIVVKTGQSNAPVAHPPVPATVQPPHGKHVLIVDDSPSVRRVVSSMLKQRGWEVQMARDGVEALEMISRDTPAAVLLDIEMPRMDGYELIATVRAQEQYRTLPLVVLTSRAAAKHQQRAILLGANSYVVKPYQDEELLNTLNTLVYGASSH